MHKYVGSEKSLFTKHSLLASIILFPLFAASDIAPSSTYVLFSLVFAGLTRGAFNDAEVVNVVVSAVVSHIQRWGVTGLTISNSTVGIASIADSTLISACIIQVQLLMKRELAGGAYVDHLTDDSVPCRCAGAERHVCEHVIRSHCDVSDPDCNTFFGLTSRLASQVRTFIALTYVNHILTSTAVTMFGLFFDVFQCKQRVLGSRNPARSRPAAAKSLLCHFRCGTSVLLHCNDV